MTAGASATSRLRLVGYAAILTALAFSQAPGRIVADTKFDLVAAPWRFLAAATNLWDPRAAFGQIQNQADGYLWPMGPFFVAGRLAALPEWVVQRLWWALLLNLAFFGMLRLLRELRVGTPWAQVAASAAFVLAPRVTSIIGESSVELWPTALAPWVLLPIVRGTERGSVVRAAAVSAFVVACCGGVNATAVSAVLPAGVIWVVTRARGPRRWRLLAWWAFFTLLATFWWLVPLALLGRYGAPFLDYIENAAVTASVTDPANTLLGTSNWTAYLGGGGYVAGSTIIGTPFLLLDAAAVAALGLAGLAHRAHPHRRFAVLVLLAGCVLVGLGHVGDVQGWWAEDRHASLDGALSALRNTHKYDVLVRLALSLGIAHLLGQPLPDLPGRLQALRRGWAGRAIAATTALVLVGLAFPWLEGKVAAPDGFRAVPAYWKQAAAYAGARPGTTLVLPAASFGDYTWGSTHDDVLQPYARGPWAVRNVVPLAEPGNVELLDRITAEVERGSGSDELAALLARAGVGTLIVRNDLQRLITGAPDPAYVHAALDNSPGLTRLTGFGNEVGQPPHAVGADGRRYFNQGGLSGRYSAVEIYGVSGTAEAGLQEAGVSVMGDPGSGLPLTGDVGTGAAGRVILTDGMRRREMAFQAVRDNAGATSPAGSAALLPGREAFHRVLPDQERWQTTETWTGVRAVTASSSRAFANAAPPLDRGAGPGAAVDADDGTSWLTPPEAAPDGQWLDVALDAPRDVSTLTLRIAPNAVPVDAVVVSAGRFETVAARPAPGQLLHLDLDATDVRSVRIEVRSDPAARGSWGLAEVRIPGVVPRRVLALPDPPDDAVVDEVRLTRDAGSAACPAVGPALACLPFLGAAGEDGDRLDRSFSLPGAGTYEVEGSVSLRRRPEAGLRLLHASGLDLTTTGSAAREVAESAAAMVDGDLGTTWRASSGASVRLRFDAPRTVRSVTLAVGEDAPARAPSEIELAAGDRRLRARVQDGRVEVPDWVTDELSIRVLEWTNVQDVSGGMVDDLQPGISELLVNSQPVVDPQVLVPCGRGPVLRVGDQVLRTTATARLADLLRGGSVPFRVCDSPSSVRLLAGRTALLTDPGRTLRPDTLTLRRPSAAAVTAQPVTVLRDERKAPVAVILPARSSPTVLAVAQNFNDAWSATLQGRHLQPQRVGGWQQGWLVPAGAAGTVRLSVAPESTYRWGLVAGALGIVLVATVAALSRRRRSRAVLPPLRAGGVGVPDVALGVLAMGLLGGWAAAAGFLAIAVTCALVPAVRRFEGWPHLAAGAALLAVVPRVVDGLEGRITVAQWCGAASVVVVVGSLLASGPTFLSRRVGRSRKR